MNALFKEVSYRLSKLIDEIEDGEIGLPDIQRPFVWKRTKVRDLFDSMYNGFPVGYLLFWANPTGGPKRQIGVGEKQSVPRLLIVDGQQRLTSLYAVMRGVPIVDDGWAESSLRIAFRPRDGRFSVPDAAIDRDPEYIRDITQLWVGPQSRNRFVKNFVNGLRENREVSENEEDDLFESIDRLFDLQNYPFTALELAANVDEVKVADVFVRINSEGVTLKQADFILTLMSVYWDSGRRALEDFSRAAKQPTATGASPFNHFIAPSPDQMLRVVVGLALRRGVLRAVYQILRGKDPDSGEFSPEIRQAHFEKLKIAQNEVLDLTNWHEFLKALQEAGYRSTAMITSDNNVLFSYLVFLIGRCDHKFDYRTLRRAIARWFFMCTITSRYTGNPETQVESDLRRFREATNADDFEGVINHSIATSLTNDFWEVSLPDLLDSSAAYSPTLFSYYAALNILGARALFSSLTVGELLDPALRAKKKALERHHLFARKYLETIGVTDNTRVNQIANYAFLEWPDNATISDAPPAEYFPQYFGKYVDSSEEELFRFWHALPVGWEEMKYGDFLEKRRGMMAEVVRAAFERMSTGAPPPVAATQAPVLATVADLLSSMETREVEFKSSAIHSYKVGIPEKVINDAIVKTIAAFMNSDGGTLAIGVSDSGQILGVEPDLGLKNFDLDRYANWLTTLIQKSLGGPPAALNAIVRFEGVDGKQVCLVDVRRSARPVFANTTKGDEVFFVRMNNTTRALPTSEVHEYIREHWES